jgi:hypothetical protein
MRISFMNITAPGTRTWLPALIFAVAAISSYPGVAVATDVNVTLSGDQEVPSIKSPGTGTGTITVGTDKSVHGSVTTKGITGTAAHIHEAAAGKTGPVVIPLEKKGDTYTVPANAKLTDAQFASFKAGNLYVNVHTAAHPDGELRGQLKP